MAFGALSRFLGKNGKGEMEKNRGEIAKTSMGGNNPNDGNAKHAHTNKHGQKAIQKPLTFWNEEKGQVSAEMLIIIAAMIAVALVLVSQLQSSAKTGAKNLDAKTDKAWSEIDKIGK
ncbi:MAG: hypothetical protein AABX01_05490 [Candidatus Micrarchaeota archaeon]